MLRSVSPCHLLANDNLVDNQTVVNSNDDRTLKDVYQLLDVHLPSFASAKEASRNRKKQTPLAGDFRAVLSATADAMGKLYNVKDVEECDHTHPDHFNGNQRTRKDYNQAFLYVLRDLINKLKIGLTTQELKHLQTGYNRDFGPHVRFHMFPLANFWEEGVAKRTHFFTRSMLEQFVFNVVSFF